MSGFNLVKHFFVKYFWMVGGGFLALVVCDLAQLLIPTILGQGIDLLGAEGTVRDDLLAPVKYILLLAAVVAVTRFAWRHLIIGFARTVEKGLRDKLYAKVIRLSPRWHLENASGDLMAMATNDMDSIRMAISAGLISIVDTLVMGCVALGFMVAISPALTLWALLPMLAITLVTHFLGRRIYLLVLEVQNVFGQLTETVREKISGLKVIRAMGLSELALGETEKMGRKYLKVNVHQALLAGTFFPFLHFMSNLAVTLVIYFGGRETILGRVSTGDFVAFITYLAMLTWPLMALGMIFGFIQQGLASLTRLNRVFSAEPENETTRDLTAPANPRPEIVFSHLTFQYPTRDYPALNDISLTLPHDKVTALVGPMGSGKSTLAALIPALYEAPAGTLKVSGLAIEKWRPADLRLLFGYVPQDGYLFSGTIAENISFGRPDAGPEEIAGAAALAGLTDDLASFPDGLETVVGERGLTLSGGQKQRLALARALLIDPPYLILDDTLSAVDASVEAEIMARLLQLRQGRGGLIISHRLTSLMGVDRVVVIEEGRISDQGTPEELMGRESYFKRINELNLLPTKSEGDNG
ncbi:ABC transporter ATP-binding protein/permease [Deltaproteobacteria bacterium OttesenSCG-928-K17]|nr:ABC transporter ATP-binding protein/permease [Deltaproteobacteria bacterium OttesenSCG-928-K17]